MRISDWSSDVCSSDLKSADEGAEHRPLHEHGGDDRCWRLIRPHPAQGRAVPPGERSPASRGFPAHQRACDHPRQHPGDRKKHTSELQSLMRISYAVFCLKKKKNNVNHSATLMPLLPIT